MTPVALPEMLPNLVGLHAVTVPGKYRLGAYYPYARTEPGRTLPEQERL